MRRESARGAAILGAALVLLLVLPAPALAIAKVIEGGRIRLHYKKAPLKQVVEEIARATGERVVFDPSLPGRFTITISHAVTRAEVLAILDATLIMQGYAVLKGDDGVLKILPIREAAGGSRWAGPVTLEEDRNKLVTTMLALKIADAEGVASQMRHLVSKQDSLIAYLPTNSLILVGTERRVRRMLELAQALDAGGLSELWVRTLRHRGAFTISEMLREALGPGQGSPAELRREDAKIWADERSNSILVMGSAAQLEQARAFVDELDQPVGVDTKIQVVRIYNRDAEDIQKILVELAVGRALGAKAAGEAVLGKNFFAVADPATNSIIVDADQDTFRSILELIARLDRAQPRIQVDIVAYEVTNPSRLRLGIDWFLPVLSPNRDGSGAAMTIASTPSGGGLRGEIGEDITFFGRASRDPLVLPFEDEDGNVVDVVLPRETVVITANAREVRTRTLMQPRLLITSGEEQRIFAGQNVPIPVGQSSAELSAVQTRSEIQRQDVGVELRVTARVGEEGKVQLDLLIDISRLAPSEAGSVDLVGPTLDERRIETKVLLSDGELAVIGLSQEGGRQEDESGTPFLKDIPVLGHLVKSGGSRNVDTHIVFAVQARLIKTHEEDLAESIRQRLALERSLSRVSGLKRNPNAPYAVLVTTRNSRQDAEELVASFEREGAKAQLGEWQRFGEDRFDVYLTGYNDLAVAGADALRLRDRGWGPQVVVLPGELAIAKSPGLRLLGGSPAVSSGAP
jgi:general secretion pathway protein D